jgi:ElaB/YqjD/DUF883 family membrane-anchored ribosome-binding protein
MADTAPENREAEAAIKDAGTDLADAGSKAADAVDVKAHDLAAAARELADKAKTRFSQAVEDARTSAETLKAEAIEKGQAYKDKATDTAAHWSDEAKALAAQAKDKGSDLALEGKAKASEALAAVGKAIAGSADAIDEKLGVKYGDYARTAAKSVEDTADKLASKDYAELGEDVKTFVRKSPATALGIAAVTGFVLARLFRGGDSKDA